MERRDIVVIGASAGGMTALVNLVRSLPADFPASDGCRRVGHDGGNHSAGQGRGGDGSSTGADREPGDWCGESARFGGDDLDEPTSDRITIELPPLEEDKTLEDNFESDTQTQQ